MMKNRIIENIDNPEILEQLYRENKQDFCTSFADISDDYDSDLVKFWRIRLASESKNDKNQFSKKNLVVVILLSLIGGFLAKIPTIFPQINPDIFYTRNLPIIVFNGIILYTFWQNQYFKKINLLVYGLALLILTLFVNLLPNTNGDTITLSLIHSPLLLWCFFCLAFTSFNYNSISKKIEFIRFNGELIIMTGLILIAGGLLTAVTIGLFSVIKIDIENFYFEYVVITGVVAAPIVSTYLVRLYPNLTSKISPVIARVFTPLVLITLAVYLVTLLFSDIKIFQDRDLLMLFNVMLIAVLAIIVFSVSELDKFKARDVNVLLLFLLAALAIVINSIALVAIVSRVLYGLTPNRLVVLVFNLIVFVNLLHIAVNLYKSYFNTTSIETVEHTVAKYLNVYAIYSIIIVFILPFIFGFK